MMNIVDRLLKFRETQCADELNCAAWISRESLNIIVIEILSWLKLEYKRTIWIDQGRRVTKKPLKLEALYPWCADCRKLLQEKNLFSETFCVQDGALMFREEITEEQRTGIRKTAYEKYNPILQK